VHETAQDSSNASLM